jgi:hypothetical protein
MRSINKGFDPFSGIGLSTHRQYAANSPTVGTVRHFVEPDVKLFQLVNNVL